MKLKGAEIIVKCLLEQNVEYVFGYPGGQIIDTSTRCTGWAAIAADSHVARAGRDARGRRLCARHR